MKNDYFLVNRHLGDLNPLICGWEECEPSHGYGPARRSYTLIHFVLSGKGILQKKEGDFPVSAGNAFLIQPGEVTYYQADREEPWVYFWVGFNGTLSGMFSELPTVLPVETEEVLRLRGQMDGSGNYEYLLLSFLYRLCALWFPSRRHRADAVELVRDRIQTLYMQPLTVEQLARECNLDRRYLSRIFKEKMGETLRDYLIRVRLENAKLLLAQGYSVSDSARFVGYEDVFNFSKMFKKYFGISPKDWQKKKRLND